MGTACFLAHSLRLPHSSSLAALLLLHVQTRDSLRRDQTTPHLDLRVHAVVTQVTFPPGPHSGWEGHDSGRVGGMGQHLSPKWQQRPAYGVWQEQTHISGLRV